MAVGRSDTLLKDLRTLYSVGSAGELSDGQLLEQFAASRDEAIFELLVERHGPMVLQICRGMLGNSHDADDAFQATFLVLVRQAGSIRDRDSMASWLFGVARRIAARSRVDAARRRKHERRAAEMASRSDVQDESPGLGPVLCEEVAKLPEKYREVVVLCCFEGNSYQAAAQRLGRPIGTVKVRLSRARRLLLDRLTRRGLGLPAGAAVLGVSAETAAGVPITLAQRTVRSVLEPSASAASRLAAHYSRSTTLLTALGAVTVVFAAAVVTLVPGVSLFRGLPTQQTASIPNAASTKPRRDSLLVQVVDTAGSPVAGARVGVGSHGVSKNRQADWQFFAPRGIERRRHRRADDREGNWPRKDVALRPSRTPGTRRVHGGFQ